MPHRDPHSIVPRDDKDDLLLAIWELLVEIRNALVPPSAAESAPAAAPATADASAPEPVKKPTARKPASKKTSTRKKPQA